MPTRVYTFLLNKWSMINLKLFILMSLCAITNKCRVRMQTLKSKLHQSLEISFGSLWYVWFVYSFFHCPYKCNIALSHLFSLVKCCNYVLFFATMSGNVLPEANSYKPHIEAQKAINCFNWGNNNISCLLKVGRWRNVRKVISIEQSQNALL